GAVTNWTANTTQDLSGKGNTGALVSMSTTTSPVPGKIGQGINFTPTTTNPYIDMGNDTVLSGATAATWSFWFYEAKTGTGRILTKWNGGLIAGQAYDIETINSGADIQFAIGDGTGVGFVLANTTATGLSLNKWYHVVVVWTAAAQ